MEDEAGAPVIIAFNPGPDSKVDFQHQVMNGGGEGPFAVIRLTDQAYRSTLPPEKELWLAEMLDDPNDYIASFPALPLRPGAAFVHGYIQSAAVLNVVGLELDGSPTSSLASGITDAMVFLDVPRSVVSTANVAILVNDDQYLPDVTAAIMKGIQDYFAETLEGETMQVTLWLITQDAHVSAGFRLRRMLAGISNWPARYRTFVLDRGSKTGLLARVASVRAAASIARTSAADAEWETSTDKLAAYTAIMCHLRADASDGSTAFGATSARHGEDDDSNASREGLLGKRSAQEMTDDITRAGGAPPLGKGRKKAQPMRLAPDQRATVQRGFEEPQALDMFDPLFMAEIPDGLKVTERRLIIANAVATNSSLTRAARKQTCDAAMEAIAEHIKQLDRGDGVRLAKAQAHIPEEERSISSIISFVAAGAKRKDVFSATMQEDLGEGLTGLDGDATINALYQLWVMEGEMEGMAKELVAIYSTAVATIDLVEPLNRNRAVVKNAMELSEVVEYKIGEELKQPLRPRARGFDYDPLLQPDANKRVVPRQYIKGLSLVAKSMRAISKLPAAEYASFAALPPRERVDAQAKFLMDYFALLSYTEHIKTHIRRTVFLTLRPHEGDDSLPNRFTPGRLERRMYPDLSGDGRMRVKYAYKAEFAFGNHTDVQSALDHALADISEFAYQSVLKAKRAGIPDAVENWKNIGYVSVDLRKVERYLAEDDVLALVNTVALYNTRSETVPEDSADADGDEDSMDDDDADARKEEGETEDDGGYCTNFWEVRFIVDDLTRLNDAVIQPALDAVVLPRVTGKDLAPGLISTLGDAAVFIYKDDLLDNFALIRGDVGDGGSSMDEGSSSAARDNADDDDDDDDEEDEDGGGGQELVSRLVLESVTVPMNIEPTRYPVTEAVLVEVEEDGRVAVKQRVQPVDPTNVLAITFDAPTTLVPGDDAPIPWAVREVDPEGVSYASVVQLPRVDFGALLVETTVSAAPSVKRRRLLIQDDDDDDEDEEDDGAGVGRGTAGLPRAYDDGKVAALFQRLARTVRDIVDNQARSDKDITRFMIILPDLPVPVLGASWPESIAWAFYGMARDLVLATWDVVYALASVVVLHRSPAFQRAIQAVFVDERDQTYIDYWNDTPGLASLTQAVKAFPEFEGHLRVGVPQDAATGTLNDGVLTVLDRGAMGKLGDMRYTSPADVVVAIPVPASMRLGDADPQVLALLDIDATTARRVDDIFFGRAGWYARMSPRKGTALVVRIPPAVRRTLPEWNFDWVAYLLPAADGTYIDAARYLLTGVNTPTYMEFLQQLSPSVEFIGEDEERVAANVVFVHPGAADDTAGIAHLTGTLVDFMRSTRARRMGFADVRIITRAAAQVEAAMTTNTRLGLLSRAVNNTGRVVNKKPIPTFRPFDWGVHVAITVQEIADFGEVLTQEFKGATPARTAVVLPAPPAEPVVPGVSAWRPASERHWAANLPAVEPVRVPVAPTEGIFDDIRAQLAAEAIDLTGDDDDDDDDDDVQDAPRPFDPPPQGRGPDAGAPSPNPRDIFGTPPPQDVLEHLVVAVPDTTPGPKMARPTGPESEDRTFSAPSPYPNVGTFIMSPGMLSVDRTKGGPAQTGPLPAARSMKARVRGVFKKAKELDIEYLVIPVLSEANRGLVETLSSFVREVREFFLAEGNVSSMIEVRIVTPKVYPATVKKADLPPGWSTFPGNRTKPLKQLVEEAMPSERGRFLVTPLNLRFYPNHPADPASRARFYARIQAQLGYDTNRIGPAVDSDAPEHRSTYLLQYPATHR